MSDLWGLIFGKGFPTPRAMCDHAFAWAKNNGLWQINPVHKEEEASLVIERLFQVHQEEGESMEHSGSFETQVRTCVCFFPTNTLS